jgi:DNA modification methylase
MQTLIRANEIKHIPINELRPHPKNPNKHGKDQIDRLADIIRYQGFRRPVTVSNLSGYVTVGHGRIEAAKKLGMEFVPVTFQDYDDDTQEYADIVADNAIDDWAELDFAMVNAEVPELGPDFDIDLLGIRDFEIEPADKYGDADAVPAPPKAAKSKLGDLWILGNHRLLCGDSTKSEDVARLMNGETACITFTSPPYNMGGNAKLRDNGKDSVYANNSDDMTEKEYLEFLIKWTDLCIKNSKNVFSNIQILAGNKFIMSDYWGHFKNHLVDLMIWDKEHAQPAAALRVLNSVWEFIFVFSAEDRPSRSMKTGKSFHGNVDNIYRLNPVGKKDPLAKDHGAVFPVQFPEHFISHFAEKSVLDVFGGSGTTLIAAEKLNRKCFMMELDPIYCDVILERWSKFSGLDPSREDGKKWSELRA